MDKRDLATIITSVAYRTLSLLGFYFVASLVIVQVFGGAAWQANSLVLLIASMLLSLIMNPHVSIEWKNTEEKDDNEQREDD